MVSVFTVLAATEETTGIAALGIDLWAILIQGTTFLVFLLIVKKFAFGKIVATLEQRREAIEGSLDKAEKLEEANQKAEAEVQKLLRQARKEAEDIISKSHDEAGAIVAEASKAAETRAEKIIADGLTKIEQQAAKTQEELKKQTLDLVTQATAALLGEAVDTKKNEQLIKRALSEAQS